MLGQRFTVISQSFGGVPSMNPAQSQPNISSERPAQNQTEIPRFLMPSGDRRHDLLGGLVEASPGLNFDHKTLPFRIHPIEAGDTGLVVLKMSDDLRENIMLLPRGEFVVLEQQRRLSEDVHPRPMEQRHSLRQGARKLDGMVRGKRGELVG